MPRKGCPLFEVSFIVLISDRVPAESTKLVFRHQLENYRLGEKLIKLVNGNFSIRVMKLPEWTFDDAILITATCAIKKDS